MANYKYTALNSKGEKKSGTIEASSKQLVSEKLRHQGLSPLNISLDSPRGSVLKIFTNNKVKSKDLVIFTRQLSTMISAGVPLTGALNTLEEQTDNKYFKKVVNNVAKDVDGGMSIGESLGKHPDVFDDVYVNMVMAGEEGGILDEILKRLATQQEKNEAIKKKIKSATMYPKIIFGIVVIAFIIIMNFIVPRIGAILKDLGGPEAELPAITTFMLSISDFMKQNGLFILIVSVAAFVIIRRYIKTPSGKYKFHGLLLRTPIIGPVITKIAIARFSRTFSSLLSAGVTILDSIEVTAGAIGNKVIEKELLEASDNVKAGGQLSESLRKSKHFPKIVSQMLAIGEETGETDTILVKIADFYEEEVDATIDGIGSIIEPLMIVVLGAMVGLVALSVMVPITSLSQNVK